MKKTVVAIVLCAALAACVPAGNSSGPEMIGREDMDPVRSCVSGKTVYRNPSTGSMIVYSPKVYEGQWEYGFDPGWYPANTPIEEICA